MRKQILIPTDFSPNAFNAVKYAFELFKNIESTFYIYHAYFIVASAKGNPMFPVPDESEYRTARETIRVQMEYLKKRISTLPGNEKHKIHFEFEYGFLTDLLKEKTKEDSIDLVVMGTRGVTNDSDIIFGRNAIKVMEKVRYCPVMAVPANVVFEELAEIVFPTNFEGKFDLKELDTVKRIGSISNSPIHILHIGTENDLSRGQKENKEFLQNHFESLECTFHWLEDVTVLDGILDFVKHRENAMICFVNRRHWFFQNIFSNPLVKNLGIHSTVPLLALHGG